MLLLHRKPRVEGHHLATWPRCDIDEMSGIIAIKVVFIGLSFSKYFNTLICMNWLYISNVNYVNYVDSVLDFLGRVWVG